MGYSSPYINPRSARANLLLRDNFKVPGMGTPCMLALGMHIGMFFWNPTLLTGGTLKPTLPFMRVEFRETLPELPKPPEIKKEEPKPRVVKKAHKSGISLAKRPVPAPIHLVKHAPRKPSEAPPAPRSRPSLVKMPKFVPHASEEDVLVPAQPTKVAMTTTLRPAAGTPAPVLRGKSRGIHASDVKFELTERGGISGAAAGRAIKIPVGEERGDLAVVAAAPELHDAPTGRHRTSSSAYQAPMGEGVGELSGKNRSGYIGRIQVGEPSEDEIVAAAGSSHGTGMDKGAEIGGPVGDRKILRRHLPEYPAWAEEKGISAIVKIYFTVKPDGTIRQGLRIVRSSGYSELDTLAKEALLAWKFSPTEARSSTEEAWGVVTFRFTLA